jgi:hypothetical protein
LTTVGAVVGLSDEVKFISTVGDIVGAAVVEQIGSLPSTNSGGWQLERDQKKKCLNKN